MHNGLLLAAHLDIAFDQGFLTVAKDGAVLASHRLPTSEREVLGLDRPETGACAMSRVASRAHLASMSLTCSCGESNAAHYTPAPAFSPRASNCAIALRALALGENAAQLKRNSLGLKTPRTQIRHPEYTLPEEWGRYAAN